jgi:hypothetical protein
LMFVTVVIHDAIAHEGRPTTSTQCHSRREEAGRGACPLPAKWLVLNECST